MFASINKSLSLLRLMRYSIFDLFVLILFAALLAWIEAPATYPGVVGYVYLLVLVAAYAAFRFRGDRPYFRSSLAVTVFYAFSLAFWWTQLWAGYFLRRPLPNAAPYWEDGIVTEGFVYPVVFFVVYTPVVIAIALFVSAATVAILNCLCLRRAGTESSIRI